jgi:hypothetical protein
LAGGDVDEEQDVDPFQSRSVDGEEVTSHRGLGVQELGPRHVGAFRCRSMPLASRICQTVEEASWWPRPLSSPWMRR